MSLGSDSLAATFFEAATIPLARLDRAGSVLVMNAAWKNLLAEPAAAVGKPLSALVAAEQTDQVGPLLASLVDGAKTRFVANLGQGVATGASRGIQFDLQLDAASETILLFAEPVTNGMTRSEKDDITVRLFRHVMDSASMVVWALDKEGVCTMHEGKGVEGRSHVGKNYFELHKNAPNGLGALVQALGGEEVRNVAAVGNGLHYETWILPSRRPDGSVSGIIGLSMDATDRMRTEQNLRDQVDLITRQSAAIRALATPIIQVWDEVLCLPVIGTVDSARTADMMQGLLEAIVREQARYAIVDLTGVEVVDTSTADHLIRLFRAAKVLGVEGILCGIRPAVAQTVVAIGLDLTSVRTMPSLREALMWCIRARGAARLDAGAGRPTA